MKESSERIYVFDAMKFIAAIFIILIHYDGLFPVDNAFIRKYIIVIMYLVEMFFVFSGFFTAEKERGISQKRFIPFFLHRTGRLMPLFWLLLIPQYICMFLAMGEITPEMTLENIAANLVVSPVLLRDLKYFIIGPGWYLSVLFICFTMEWAVLFFTKRKDRDPVPVYILLIILGVSMIRSLPKIDDTGLNSFMNVTGRGITAFFSGCLLKHVTHVFYGRKAMMTGLVMTLICVLSVFVPYTMYMEKTLVVSLILYPGFMLFVLNCDWLKRLFRRKFIKELGDISYTLFVSNVVLLSAELILFTNCPRLAAHQNSLASMMISTAIIITLCVPLHYYVELPLVRKFMAAVERMLRESDERHEKERLSGQNGTR